MCNCDKSKIETFVLSRELNNPSNSDSVWTIKLEQDARLMSIHVGVRSSQVMGNNTSVVILEVPESDKGLGSVPLEEVSGVWAPTRSNFSVCMGINLQQLTDRMYFSNGLPIPMGEPFKVYGSFAVDNPSHTLVVSLVFEKDI